jgi:hypothetical protein
MDKMVEQLAIILLDAARLSRKIKRTTPNLTIRMTTKSSTMMLDLDKKMDLDSSNNNFDIKKFKSRSKVRMPARIAKWHSSKDSSRAPVNH